MKIRNVANRRFGGIAMFAAIAFAAMESAGPVLADPLDKVKAGARIAHEVTKGNCLACHAMPADVAAVTSANIGPPLAAMKARFPDRDKLRAQLWDAGAANADTVMPPFGKNRVLTGEEIDLIIDYLYTL
jgi:L-cysteine S-thiosulfotransferase